MQNLSDKLLLTADDDQSAFRVLYDRYWHLLYTKSLNRLGSDADAQDVVQEVFISCWKNKSTIQIEESLLPYLLTAVKYCIIRKVYRAAKKNTVFPLSLIDLGHVELTVEEFIHYKELQTVIDKEVNLLPDRMKEVYKLSRVHHLRNEEIAERLHITEQTVKNTLSSALKKLRLRLSHFSAFLPFLL